MRFSIRDSLAVSMSSSEPLSPESTSYSFPESEGSPTSEPESSPSNTLAEPIPEWAAATATWKWFWDVHWIGIGCLFTLLALYALWSVVNVARGSKKRRRVLSMFVCSMMLVLGLSRALFLFINPYESPQCHVIPACPVILTRTLFGLGLPCLTAAFSFLQLVFLQVVKMKLYPGKIQKWKFLLTIVVIHFSLVLVIEVIVFLYADWRSLLLICQVFFIIFSVVLSTSFIYMGRRIIHRVNLSAQRVLSMGTRSGVKTRSVRSPKPILSKLVRITFLTAGLGFVSCALQLYSIFVVYDMYRFKTKQKPEPWSWLIFQTLYRIVELLTGITIAYISPRQATEEKKSLLPAHLPSFRVKSRRQGPSAFFLESGTSDASTYQLTDLDRPL